MTHNIKIKDYYKLQMNFMHWVLTLGAICSTSMAVEYGWMFVSISFNQLLI